MADEVQFIGMVSEKVFSNGGSIIKLSLGDKDKALLKGPGFTNIAIQKSKAGKWYAKIDTFVPRDAPAPLSNDDSDLPF